MNLDTLPKSLTKQLKSETTSSGSSSDGVVLKVADRLKVTSETPVTLRMPKRLRSKNFF